MMIYYSSNSTFWQSWLYVLFNFLFAPGQCPTIIFQGRWIGCHNCRKIQIQYHQYLYPPRRRVTHQLRVKRKRLLLNTTNNGITGNVVEKLGDEPRYRETDSQFERQDSRGRNEIEKVRNFDISLYKLEKCKLSNKNSCSFLTLRRAWSNSVWHVKFFSTSL